MAHIICSTKNECIKIRKNTLALRLLRKAVRIITLIKLTTCRKGAESQNNKYNQRNGHIAAVSQLKAAETKVKVF